VELEPAVTVAVGVTRMAVLEMISVELAPAVVVVAAAVVVAGGSAAVVVELSVGVAAEVVVTPS